VDQSALTGESKDADKRPAKCFRRVCRPAGEGNGVVILTGAKTYFGRTTELVQERAKNLHRSRRDQDRPLAFVIVVRCWAWWSCCR